jgi:hypothetical protein
MSLHVCLKDVDGVLLLVDPAQPEQERQLEQLYLRFAQPNSLTMKQCMVMGLSVARGSDAGAAGWAGGCCYRWLCSSDTNSQQRDREDSTSRAWW